MKYISIAYSEKKKVNKPQKVYDKSFFINCYNSRVIQEYSQAKFGRNKNIQPGTEKQHFKI